MKGLGNLAAQAGGLVSALSQSVASTGTIAPELLAEDQAGAAAAHSSRMAAILQPSFLIYSAASAWKIRRLRRHSLLALQCHRRLLRSPLTSFYSRESSQVS